MAACDFSTTAGINVTVARGTAPTGVAADITPTGTTGVAAAPGCGYFTVTPSSPTTIDNAAQNYWIYFTWVGTGFGSNVRVHSFRVYYRLQVNPPPIVATFTDVPTSHPFFRFVEAMAGRALPLDVVRGSSARMARSRAGSLAVFLASALGLHFPN